MKWFNLLRFSALVCCIVMAGCSGTAAAYKEAKDPAEYAYVLSEHYASLVDQAATLKERGSLPPGIVAALRQADDAAKPVIMKLRGLRATYVDASSAQTQAELQAAIDEAVRVIEDMQRAVTTARGARIGMLERTINLEAINHEHASGVLYAGAGANFVACRSTGAVCIWPGARGSSEPL